MYNSKNEKIAVTCLYCAHHDLRYTSEKVCFPKSNEGTCRLKNVERLGTGKICDNFKIKSGFYTTKWYPGKK